MHQPPSTRRRRVLQGIAGLAGLALKPSIAMPATNAPLLKKIPVSGEAIPAIGLGTWQAFDVAPSGAAADERAGVLHDFLEAGGRVVDSSPMYGKAEAVIGYCRAKLGRAPQMFTATKVWTHGKAAGIEQMTRSLKLWGLEKFDLMQIHNFVDWETHLATLKDWKAQGRIRYIGVTTSHDQRYDEMEKAIDTESAFDFVQFNYSVGDLLAERRLLPAAMAKGKAVIVNQPFGTGNLFARVKGKALPPWAADLGIKAWSQYFLKFVISHPAVTVAIPATSSVAHLREDMAALQSPMPDEKQRKEMAEYFASVAG
jgi:diketogulonate reductase-like aldo/keto reductase